MSSSPTLDSIANVFTAGIHCGIKPSAKDLAYIYLPQGTASAAVFTQNAFCAPCVSISRAHFQAGVVKAVIINSGNANAGTGEQGVRNCVRMAELCASELGITVEEVAIASTGVIGKQLPMEQLETGIKKLLSSPEQKDANTSAEAILTTDTRTKTAGRRARIAGQEIQIAGIAKGSGMIAPNMATMLAFIASDANVSQSKLSPILRRAVNASFNMISVDSDTSTNDMVQLFLDGSKSEELDTEEALAAFETQLTECCIELAKKIVLDGEGATKLLTVDVTQASSLTVARALALSVLNSPLVKTAIHGADPNWGRVLMALGKAPEADFSTDTIRVSFQDIPVFEDGNPLAFDRSSLRKALQEDEVRICIELNNGSACARGWGCDLSKGYIDINVEYN